MVLSGVAMVIYDSRIIHNGLKKIRNKFRRHQEQQIELGTDVFPGQTQGIQRVDNPESETSASGVSRRPTDDGDNGSEANPTQETPQIRPETVMVPYSIAVGLLIFAFFVLSFIIVMVLRGVLNDAPLLFRFFANIYLAGKSPFSYED